MQSVNYENKVQEIIQTAFEYANALSYADANHFDFLVAQSNADNLLNIMEMLHIGERYKRRVSKSEIDKARTFQRYWKENPLVNTDFQPYHHVTHTQSVCLNALEGYLYGLINGGLFDLSVVESSEDFAQTVFKSLQALMLAAMYHDAGHRYGAVADSENIITAKRCYSSSLEVSEAFSDGRVRELISSTQFPHSEDLDALGCVDEEKGVPYRQLALILRDADMMGSYEQDKETLETLFVGLFLETKLKTPDLTVAQFNINQKNFCANMVKWNTTWAKEKAKIMDWDNCHLEVAKVVNVNNPKLKALAESGVITL